MTESIFKKKLADLDPAVYDLIQVEAERQQRKLILIPSESSAPEAVREALGSIFQNLYAEGYPDEKTRWMSEKEILDYSTHLTHYRRFSDPRYYKGVEYADQVEALARRRCAEVFAANGYSADQIYVNVQPLSGAPAINAVYTALINPGDTLMGLNLLHGGHLTHGSPANRSGKLFQVVDYTVDPETEKLDYDRIQALATEARPKIIVAGYSSYPWTPDWKRFRAIADSVGAYLLADISHTAGLVAAGAVPSPIGYAHVVVFTTHKSLCGPRGACILTLDAALAKKIDRGVFPGEQGGPHMHAIAAMAVSFKLANTQAFRDLQSQILKNAFVLADRLMARGLVIPFGGTDTHLINLDCKSVVGADGTQLSGDMAARILDLAGLVTNRNTIPGDKNAGAASGIRLGAPWVTQRGLAEEDMAEIADIIADLFQAITPFSVQTKQGMVKRAKVDFFVLQQARLRVRGLIEKTSPDRSQDRHGYPHFYYLDQGTPEDPNLAYVDLKLTGQAVRSFLNFVLTGDVESLRPGESQATQLSTQQGMVDGVLTCVKPYEFTLQVHAAQAGLAATWLRDLSDGFIGFDVDPSRRLPGPIVVVDTPSAVQTVPTQQPVQTCKPYVVGGKIFDAAPLPEFSWKEAETPLRKTALNQVHRETGAKMVPFAGWDMPVWYSSVVEEHNATRMAAGLFDVSHMGVYQAEGPDASAFLDSVMGNDISGIEIGESVYTHLLDPHARVIDDTLVYRRGFEKFLVVVNASNDDKDWAWLNAVREGRVCVDPKNPGARAFGRDVVLRNLRDPRAGVDMRVDIALQGPRSRDILLALGVDAPNRKKILTLKRTQLCDAEVGGFDLIVSRTGYTGERMAFELFVHPDSAVNFWKALLAAGEPLGLKPCGLGARDSLRTEAGLPLYGHEMGGESGLGVADAGFGSYVKTYKPWFIGRDAYLEGEKTRQGVVVRFRFTEKGVRMAHNGDPVLDKKGRVIGSVTSCAVDKEGFLTGQAYVELKSAEEGTPVAILQSAPKTVGKAPSDLKSGDRYLLPTPAVVVSRFPKG